MIAKLAIFLARMLEPFDETILMTVADGAGTFARVVERRVGFGARTTDSTCILVFHDGLRLWRVGHVVVMQCMLE